MNNQNRNKGQQSSNQTGQNRNPNQGGQNRNQPGHGNKDDKNKGGR